MFRHAGWMRAIGCCVVILLIGDAVTAEAARYSLIVDGRMSGPLAASPASPPPPGFPAARRYRPVQLLPLVAQPEGLAVGDTLVLDLFEDAAFVARIDRIAREINGVAVVRGRIEGFALGTVLITSTGARSLACIEVPENGQRFMIQGDPGDGGHYLLDLDEEALDMLPDAPAPPSPAGLQGLHASGAASSSAGPLDPATIDVMVVYTPAARQWADSSGGGIANVVAQAMQKAQLAMDNSGTMMTMRLVHSAEVSYTESGSSGTDLNRLTNTSDTYLDSVHALRTQYGADLVSLLTCVEDTGGLGWLLTSTQGDPAYAFCISRVQQTSWTYTTVHELGHNMGCHHRTDQAVQPGPGLFSYSAGWHWIGTNSGKYCSVMSYDDGGYTTVGYFSNPGILHQGVATGDAVNGDNARSLREIKHVVAAYRAGANTLPATPALVSPADGATGQSLTPTLEATSFSDPDGDTHANSRWQVDNDSGFVSPEWDSGQAYAAGSQATVPAGQLASGVTYFWRVSYKDSRGAWSNWSAARSFTTLPPMPLDQALDNASLTWTTGGAANWFGQGTFVHDGVDAAQSGDVTDIQESWVQATVTGPATVTFWWKASSESNWDFLELYIDGGLKDRISGEVNWQQKEFFVPAGSHTFKWRYMKDGSLSAGFDCGWLDQVSVRAYIPGDVNHDDAVDVEDVLTTGDSWGKTSGQSGYNSLCDLNGDNAVNSADLAIVAGHWAQRLP